MIAGCCELARDGRSGAFGCFRHVSHPLAGCGQHLAAASRELSRGLRSFRQFSGAPMDSRKYLRAVWRYWRPFGALRELSGPFGVLWKHRETFRLPLLLRGIRIRGPKGGGPRLSRSCRRPEVHRQASSCKPLSICNSLHETQEAWKLR